MSGSYTPVNDAIVETTFNRRTGVWRTEVRSVMTGAPLGAPVLTHHVLSAAIAHASAVEEARARPPVRLAMRCATGWYAGGAQHAPLLATAPEEAQPVTAEQACAFSRSMWKAHIFPIEK